MTRSAESKLCRYVRRFNPAHLQSEISRAVCPSDRTPFAKLSLHRVYAQAQPMNVVMV